MSHTKLPLPAKLAFGLGDFGFNLVWTGTSLFLMYVYTDVFGLSPIIAGSINALALFWDAVTDPVMGMIIDRTRTRWGRYRPWIGFGAVPLAASYVLAFWNPGFEGMALVAWVAFTHCLLRTFYTIAGIPFSSLQARLTSDANERETLAGFRMMRAAMGGLSVALVTPIMVSRAGPAAEGTGYLLAALAAAVLAILIFAYVVAVTREPPETEGASDVIAPFAGDLKSFFSQAVTNGTLIRVFIVIVAVGVAVAMFSKNLIYYFKYILEAPQDVGMALITPALTMLLMVPAWVLRARRTSKRFPWMLGSALAGTGFIAFYFNPIQEVPVVMGVIMLISLCTSSFGVLFWSIVPDTVKWGEAQHGQRHEANVFRLAAFAQKAALGMNALLLGFFGMALASLLTKTSQKPH
ncbi:MAG TPA: hypothetical protein DIU09_06010 [Hyphomonadaceae bacterium]|nr:hypothetical protein AEM38_02405 [Hyphomonadaceae bacterium UKL13-1]HCP64127.1 hypothetical protein [Hyphomonadaceae bacterium]